MIAGYDGETVLFWDLQTTTHQGGMTMLWCEACGEAWPSPELDHLEETLGDSVEVRVPPAPTRKTSTQDRTRSIVLDKE